MKKMLFLMAIVVLVISQSYGQINPSTFDLAASPRSISTTTCGISGAPAPTSVIHTGYDLFQIGPFTVQVMVWSGTIASPGGFAWNITTSGGTTIGSFLSNSAQFPVGWQNMTDMDVVVHNLNNGAAGAFAIVVGRRVDGRIGWVRFETQGSTFNPIGATAQGILGYSADCNHPNIDVNNNGFIGICWQEKREINTSAEITIPGFPTSPITLSPIVVRRADVYAAFGWINGTDPSGVPGTTIRGIAGFPLGDLISNPDVISLSVENEFPDIAIKDDPTNINDGANIIPHFITWSRTYWDMKNFEEKSDVQIRERFTLAPANHTLSTTDISFTGRGFRGVPRIAARPLNLGGGMNFDDYQIVFYPRITDCNTSTPVNTGTRILNWGRHNNSIVNVAPVNITNLFLPGLTLATTTAGINLNPVVTYQNVVGGNNGNYIVTWEHQRTGTVGIPSPPAVGRDIIATTMRAGALAPGVTTVSFVNGRCNLSGAPLLIGNQNTPSIAGRYALTNINGYCFYDNNGSNSYIAYKTSLNTTPGLVGLGSLRQANDIESTNSTDLILSPNPTKSSLDVQLTNKNNIEKIEIYSSNGQLVLKKDSIKNNSDNIDVSKLANGLYIISVETLSGESLNKEFIKE